MSKAPQSDAPLLVSMLLYVLRLEPSEQNGPSNWYVGVSYCLNNRIAQHTSGRGSAWTRMHPVVEIAEVRMNATLTMERELTLSYMRRYGWEQVRGGPYSNPDLPRAPKALSGRLRQRKLTSYEGCIVPASARAAGTDSSRAENHTTGSAAACG